MGFGHKMRHVDRHRELFKKVPWGPAVDRLTEFVALP